MGEVYLAYDSRLRRQVAIKLLPVEFTENKARLSRFEREAYAASSLNHPNILTIYEIGEQDDLTFVLHFELRLSIVIAWIASGGT